jgi:hypothetical protein
MIELGMIRDIVTIFGVIAGFTYYVMAVRNANEARKTQTWLSTSLQVDEKFLLDFATVLHYEWEDWNDYRKKYNWYTNPEEWAKFMSLGAYYEWLGIMVKKGMINADDIYDYGGNACTMLWYKYREIVEEMRKVDDPRHLHWWEYLVGEMERINDQRGETLFGLKR